MNVLSIVFTILSLGSFPMWVESKESTLKPSDLNKRTIVATDSMVLGSDMVSSIRKAYERGDYNKFLKEMDRSFVEAKEKSELASLAEMRLGVIPEWQEWELLVQKLQQEKSQDLLQLVEGQKKGPFVDKVLFAAASLSDKAHQQAIDRILQFRQMAPGQGKNEDENRLIDLDLEYEYKVLHLDLPGALTAEKREKQSALKMEKLTRMSELAKKFQDESLKRAVALYVENFDERLAQSWDLADLNALANGKMKPKSSLEEQVAALLVRYQEKLSDETKKFTL